MSLVTGSVVFPVVAFALLFGSINWVPPCDSWVVCPWIGGVVLFAATTVNKITTHTHLPNARHVNKTHTTLHLLNRKIKNKTTSAKKGYM